MAPVFDCVGDPEDAGAAELDVDAGDDVGVELVELEVALTAKFELKRRARPKLE
jgi:hypothetical protein